MRIKYLTFYIRLHDHEAAPNTGFQEIHIQFDHQLANCSKLGQLGLRLRRKGLWQMETQAASMSTIDASVHKLS